VTDTPLSVKLLPRELKVGHVAEVWAPAANDPNSTGGRTWTWRKIVFIEKRPGRRAGYVTDPSLPAGYGKRYQEGTPARYKVRYEGVPGTSTLTPSARVTVTLASVRAVLEEKS
jgi:hypothetical protein